MSMPRGAGNERFLNAVLTLRSIAGGQCPATIADRGTPGRMEMRRRNETLLVAVLAGLVIVGAAAFVVQPGVAGKSSAPRIIGETTLLEGVALGMTTAG
jgi:hypothetical protein